MKHLILVKPTAGKPFEIRGSRTSSTAARREANRIQSEGRVYCAISMTARDWADYRSACAA